MLAQVLAFVLSISLGIHVALIAVSVYRVWHGENLIDHLMGADLVTTLMLAILVLMAAVARAFGPPKAPPNMHCLLEPYLSNGLRF